MRRVIMVALSVIVVALLGVATNVATGALPEGSSPYLWLAWPLLILLVVVLVVIEATRGREPRLAATASPARARRVLLERVRRYWITSVLDRSLYEEARIELGIAATADDRRHPWSLRASGRDGFTGALDDRASVSALFDRLDRAVVILGAPGAGKTTTLLELARDLLAGAEADPEAPVPVVVNLSSWATDRRPLDRWLVDQLTERYGIPNAQAAAWVDGGEILPLLDGLDEVAEEYRDGCAAAIAAFHARQPLTPIAVCCRLAEYDRLHRQLPLYGTVTIQPLTRAQIERYLDRPGLAGLRAALAADPELWQFADSPLLLSIMALAYADGPDPARAGAENRRERLFTRYVDTMLRHRPHPRYRPDRTVRYLSVLAGQLRERRQTIFLLDSVSDAWIPREPVAGTDASPPRWLDSDIAARLVTCAGLTLALAAAGYALLGPRGALVGAVGGLLTAAATTTYRYDDLFTIAYALRLGDPAGPRTQGLREYRTPWMRKSVDGLRDLVNPRTGIDWTALVGLALAGLTVGLAFGLPGGVPAGLLFGLSFLVAALVAVGVSAAVMFQLFGVRPPGTRRELPTGLLLHRLALAGRAALVVGALTGGAAALVVADQATPADAARYGLLVGLTCAAMPLLLVAGAPITEQWLVRRRLARLDLLPRPLLPFLGYAVQCLFLRDVGDGYLFVHRELLEFFADQRPEPAAEPAERGQLAGPRTSPEPAAPELPAGPRADSA
ncbi:NACHT domain-containing protein [Micromonospora coerulea]|uniref:NACHT domain-containing protein n=1 Tax=Micromonospora coerulea TaxID=47856 RepID=UPI001904845A|nr:NACHT domain-containing protein [Micromonospora veneta]